MIEPNRNLAPERVGHLPPESRIAVRPTRRPLVVPETTQEKLKFWVWPMGILISITTFLYLGFGLLNFNFHGEDSFLVLAFSSSGEAVADALNPFTGFLSAILGIMITVIAIVLQLAAQRYGTRLIDLFLEDQVNRAYFAFMVCTLIYSVYITYSIKDTFFAQLAIFLLVVATQVEIALLAPYFLYLFKFLTPTNLLHSIQVSSKTAVLSVIKTKPGESLGPAQAEVAGAIEQVTDSALSAVNQMDRNLGLMALNQMREMVLDYQQLKQQLPPEWFIVPQEYFVGISQVFYQEICEKRLWVETKACMDLELIYKNSIRVMPDAVSTIARNIRLLAEEAIRDRDDEVLDLMVQFFNTYIRIAINDKNVRVIFNLFYQYRLLAEAVMDYDPEVASKILFYFKYYGETCLQQGLWFVMLTAAFDLGGMVAVAYDKKVKNFEKMLLVFLSLEDNVDPKKDFLAFDAIRKAQLILSTYMYSKGESALIGLVIEDLKSETLEKLHHYRNALLGVKSKKFWEVTDRGYTFEYMEPDQKEWLGRFFEEYILPQQHLFKQAPAEVAPVLTERQRLEREAQEQLANESLKEAAVQKAQAETLDQEAAKAAKRTTRKKDGTEKPAKAPRKPRVPKTPPSDQAV
ncbi:MAG: hypothetical protein A2600_08995 [Candidatus Lambdaproteobacteria bacterium RIFOXYD1_FULL_56_27]|uniref:DUF2254 domain-containing protein n=1 Tax=Candidatus Lambdaproteobacteria bacterium RIFOXYD2_FULL_56_26 TaxID=1817773 RepID=A0A1F6GZ16_9PROT|nr:MAG: hypothetical protein A2426_10415 [Candidatus Lambdaproteobacteria bacterium RIFOXYC1_FULL_56_13]OGH03329.1 MAG: hypothetical protein A2557_02270 [Candidatus Lambdaproteobacteria bacterium RIFOXYD2_FULL_56_26]OGH06666.1 MAG: hypothetical protein A2600_08995 [Candidatus Lambdaproteobacteria bacterium RIFOXYD1_FULL_56_27]